MFLAGVSSIALAQQTYPAKPIRMVAPFAAGGLVDVLARAVGEKLRPALGQPVIIDNRPGAGGNIGADLVAKAEADGYTLLMSSAGILTINESLYAKMPFNAATAFAPVSLVAEMHMLIQVSIEPLDSLNGVAALPQIAERCSCDNENRICVLTDVISKSTEAL